MSASRVPLVAPEELKHSWRRQAQQVDVAAVEEALRNAVSGEVRFDAGSRALYATDGSNYRQVPIGVVIPKSKEDVIATVAVCRRFGAPLLSRGGGTSLAGQCCNVAVVIDWSKYLHHIVELNPQEKICARSARDDLRHASQRRQTPHLDLGSRPRHA